MRLLSNLSFCLVMVVISIQIDKILDKNISWMAHPWRRLLFQTLFQILGALIVVCLAVIISSAFKDSFETSPPLIQIKEGIYILLSIVLLSLVISSLNTGAYLLGNWKGAAMKAMEYKLKAAQNRQLVSELELQALKLQLDPHFVFNNLSALSELVLKDQRLGYEYTENFTKVYRYLLVNSKKKLIYLSEEMEFLKAYQFLIKHRMGKGCQIQVNIEKTKLGLRIPPMTLQLLIENAIKHNRIEENDPLVINVQLNDGNELEISNNVLPLTREIDSTKMGLENINARYALIGGSKPVIEKSHEVFKVKISLFQ
ncbi:histidine kinase [Muricauda oceani]|uniref:Histidine kinase n=1 Tax=Flagellimonas oceani TaxID=2698672 RepID=A0A6G7IZL9_9FLAO|nr:histidine kinase [Allomuricauda oceani]MBW8243637.1 histidine kinase [Allomuricauda oceani]QII43996.1 histidine kinase [Allomuricauda oceani]